MRWRIIAIASVVFALLSGSLSVVGSQRAMADESCAANLNLEVPSAEEARDKTLVLTVHGLRGDKGSLQAMSEELGAIEGVAVKTFDYEPTNDKWVVGSGTAHRLAKTVVCYSALYNGKDIVLVTHSMGGLLAREALDWAADGTFVKDVVGHVVSIAPPHKGSQLANVEADLRLSACKDPFPGLFTFFVESACREIAASRAVTGLSVDSDQLAELPKFPEGVTVKTIAGHATWRICAPWGCSPGVDQNGDLVVSVDSATAEYTETTAWDGKAVLECDTSVPIAKVSKAWCEHGNMLRAEQFHREVKASVEAYLAANAEPEFDPTDPKWRLVMFDKLAIPDLGQDWGGAMSEPEYFISMRDYTNCTRETTAECPSFYFTNLDTDPYHSDSDQPVLAALEAWCDGLGRDELRSLLEVSERNIGNKVAEFYTLDECPNTESEYHDPDWDVTRVWYVVDERVIITARDTMYGTIDMQVLEESLRQAEWS